MTSIYLEQSDIERGFQRQHFVNCRIPFSLYTAICFSIIIPKLYLFERLKEIRIFFSVNLTAKKQYKVSKLCPSFDNLHPF